MKRRGGSPLPRILFMGSPSFAVPIFEALVDLYPGAVRAVVTQPPKVRGRGDRVQKTPVHLAAEALGLPVYTPSRFNAASQEIFAAHPPDLMLVAAYGHLLSQEVLEKPRYGCLNFHASLLPRHRGASPIEHAILSGDRETGVCLMKMTVGMDEGPVLARQTIVLRGNETAPELYEALSHLSVRVLENALPSFFEGFLVPVPQGDQGVSYAPKLQTSNFALSFSEPAVLISRKIRAFYPKAHFYHHGKRFRVLQAGIRYTPNNALPGTILDEPLVVKCGEDALALEVLQAEGKTPLEAAAFCCGQRAFRVGEKLEVSRFAAS